MAPWKGCDVLIQAFRGLPPGLKATLDIYSNLERYKPFVKRLRQLAKGDKRINYAGPFQRENVGEVLSGLDVLVVPSRWYENQPGVIFEAFAAGMPVVAVGLGAPMLDHCALVLNHTDARFRRDGEGYVGVFVAEDAQIGYPPVRLMSPPDMQFHPWMVGMRRAMELMLTGDAMSGTEAAEWGYATRAFPLTELEAATLAFAERAAKIPTDLQQLNKRSVHRAMEIMGARAAMRRRLPLRDSRSPAPHDDGLCVVASSVNCSSRHSY
jgi:hypothetical protein